MKITGQILVRETNVVIDGRKVVMLIGMIAAGEGETIGLKGEHQYSVVGMDVMGDLRLQLIQASAIDRTDMAEAGMRVDQLITSPIWRI